MFPVVRRRLSDVLLVLAPLVIFAQALESSHWVHFWGYFSAGIMLFTSVIMNFYPIHYIHMGRSMSRHPWFGRANILLLLLFISTPYFGHFCLGYMLLYVLSPLVTWRINPEDAARESRRISPQSE